MIGTTESANFILAADWVLLGISWYYPSRWLVTAELADPIWADDWLPLNQLILPKQLNGYRWISWFYPSSWLVTAESVDPTRQLIGYLWVSWVYPTSWLVTAESADPTLAGGWLPLNQLILPKQMIGYCWISWSYPSRWLITTESADPIRAAELLPLNQLILPKQLIGHRWISWFYLSSGSVPSKSADPTRTADWFPQLYQQLLFRQLIGSSRYFPVYERGFTGWGIYYRQFPSGALLTKITKNTKSYFFNWKIISSRIIFSNPFNLFLWI